MVFAQFTCFDNGCLLNGMCFGYLFNICLLNVMYSVIFAYPIDVYFIHMFLIEGLSMYVCFMECVNCFKIQFIPSTCLFFECFSIDMFDL